MAKLLRNGQPVPTKDVEVVVKNDVVLVTFRKPVRESSGPYEFALSNSQGETKLPLNINILGKHFPHVRTNEGSVASLARRQSAGLRFFDGGFETRPCQLSSRLHVKRSRVFETSLRYSAAHNVPLLQRISSEASL